jgi:DNA excision repair protein ERCC-2
MRREILALEKVNRPTVSSREAIVASVPDSFTSCMEQLISAIETALREQQSRGNENPLLLGGYFEIIAFLRALERRAEEDIVYLKRTGNGLTVKVFSLDPAARIRETLKRTNARAIFFSATLAPHEFYRRLLGATPDDPSLLSQSPFSRRNRFVAVLDCISTRFRDRDKTADRVARAIESVVATRVGHFIVFFPSFAYLDLMEKRLSFNTDDVELIRQYPRQSREAKRSFVDAFKRSPDEAPQKSLVGLAVMGGLYGEALDLPGEQLIGAVIVGPGLPKITFEREQIRAHFAKKLSDGFGFAYLYPGMNKVIQAGGRVIRRERDKGVIVLIGNRFAAPEYGRLLPHDWAPVPILGSVEALRERLLDFWKSDD